MHCRNMLCAFVLFSLMVSAGWGQAKQLDVQKLHQQIQMLQEQLDKLENTGREKSRVTQIGGSRLRARSPQMVVRIYDLSDLFAVAPPYVAEYPMDLGGVGGPLFSGGPRQYTGTGGFGGFGGGGFWNVKSRIPQGKASKAPTEVLRQIEGPSGEGESSARTSINELITTIQKTISPDIWQDAGGPASIARLANAFVISADEDTHEQIDALLDLFRKRWGTLRTVSVRAYWLWLTDAELDPLLDNVDHRKPEADPVRTFGLVKQAEWQILMQRLRQVQDDRRTGYRAAITCYNGQTVHTLAGGNSLAVTEIEPVVIDDEGEKAKGQVAYRPGVQVIQEGAALQITPIANLSGTIVLLDIHSRVCILNEPDVEKQKEARQEKRREPNPLEVVAALDRPRLMLHRLSTTLRIPINRVMLVGGMTVDNKPEPDTPSLYLFVKVAVQELRDDRSEQAKPANAPKPEQKKPANKDAKEPKP